METAVVQEILMRIWRRQADRFLESACPDIGAAPGVSWREIGAARQNHLLYCPWCFDMFRIEAAWQRSRNAIETRRIPSLETFWTGCASALKTQMDRVSASLIPDRLPGPFATASAFRRPAGVQPAADTTLRTTPEIYALNLSELPELFPSGMRKEMDFFGKTGNLRLAIHGLDPALTGRTAYLLVARLADLQEYDETERVENIAGFVQSLVKEIRTHPASEMRVLLDPLFKRSQSFSRTIDGDADGGTVVFDMTCSGSQEMMGPLRVWFFLAGL